VFTIYEHQDERTFAIYVYSHGIQISVPCYICLAYGVQSALTRPSVLGNKTGYRVVFLLDSQVVRYSVFVR
jgi:hypothetical protein